MPYAGIEAQFDTIWAKSESMALQWNKYTQQCEGDILTKEFITADITYQPLRGDKKK